MKTKINPSFVSEPQTDSDWSIAFSGADKYKVPLFPDGQAIYWFYALTLSKDQPLGIRIKGAFNHARFMSLSVYDDETGNTVAMQRASLKGQWTSPPRALLL